MVLSVVEFAGTVTPSHRLELLQRVTQLPPDLTSLINSPRDRFIRRRQYIYSLPKDSVVKISFTDGSYPIGAWDERNCNSQQQI